VPLLREGRRDWDRAGKRRALAHLGGLLGGCCRRGRAPRRPCRQRQVATQRGEEADHVDIAHVLRRVGDSAAIRLRLVNIAAQLGEELHERTVAAHKCHVEGGYPDRPLREIDEIL
jgi:hypothetical protein